jgi:hypothetical protein
MKEGAMKRTLRLLVLVSAGALALAFAVPALAAYNQNIELAVQQSSYKPGAAAGPGFLFFSDANNDATAKMKIFSPAGYVNTLTQAPGTTVGQAYALVKAGALGGAILPLAGPVTVGNPSDPALQAASQQCRGTPAPNQEILVLNTSLQGQSIQVPDFLNTSGPYVTQEICLPPPAAAAFQAQVVLANFTIKGIFTNAATTGAHQWAGDFTPYAGTVPNAAGTVELRTYVGLPSSLTLKRARSKARFVKFTGKLAVSGLNVAGIKLDLYYSTLSSPAPNFTKPSKAGITGKGKVVRTKSLKGNGTFSITRPKVKKRTYFQARLEDEWALRECQGPSPSGLPIPCLEEILSPLTSNQVRVLPPRHR